MVLGEMVSGMLWSVDVKDQVPNVNMCQYICIWTQSTCCRANKKTWGEYGSWYKVVLYVYYVAHRFGHWFRLSNFVQYHHRQKLSRNESTVSVRFSGTKHDWNEDINGSSGGWDTKQVDIHKWSWLHTGYVLHHQYLSNLRNEQCRIIGIWKRDLWSYQCLVWMVLYRASAHECIYMTTLPNHWNGGTCTGDSWGQYCHSKC